MWGPEFKPFWDHWAINPWLGGVKNGPFWTKNGQTWQACQRSKVVQKGPKVSKMVNLSVFDHLGPFWAHLDHFGPFQTKIDFLLRSTSATPIWGKKFIFVWNGPKGSRWAQKGPKWSKTLRLTILDPFGPFWTTLERWQACHAWPFLVQGGPFLTPPSHGFVARWSQNGLSSGPHMGWVYSGWMGSLFEHGCVTDDGGSESHAKGGSSYGHFPP